ncbi:hypothetical protein [Corynebacterium tuberculostearicum]|uniref:hypothetical protein n=1 Tax=Corynebacterium tuberculostearicum TaxID=38304 RepID=UPI0025436F3E|nr:hypothetical protein [Corynebacterium tuberculostearicum]MDK4230307.1 hypothetical protein [Corynebacterium tuberculostearicum]
MEVSADLSVLLVTQEWAKSLEALPEELRARGFEPLSIFTLQVAEETSESSPLAQEYCFRFGQWPQGIPVWRLIVNGETTQPLATVASSVADCLPPAASWVGSAEIGFTEMGLGAPAVWRADSGL